MDTIHAQKQSEEKFKGFCLKVWEMGSNLSKQPPTAKRLLVRDLCTAYLAVLSIPHTEMDKRGLIAIFSDHGEQSDENPYVTQRKLMMFMLRFGPPEASLAKVRDVLQRGKIWFHGNQDREASARILIEAAVNGSFLVRYSSVVGCFTVDYLKGTKISHFNNIRNDTEGGIKVVTGKAETKKIYKYTNLSSFVGRNKHIFSVPCINARSHFQWLKQIPWENIPAENAKSSASKEQSQSMEEEVKERLLQCFEEKKQTLDLRHCGIGPELPPKVCALTELVHLDVSGNRLEFVPPELGNLIALESVNLSDNMISRLPPHLFDGWQRLESFLCSENNLAEVPDELFSVTTILHMDLSHNGLEKIPPTICRLTQLQFLQVSVNKLTDLPVEMSKLDALEELYLNANRLRGIPRWITNLSNLFLLDVSENQIAPEAVPLPFIHFLLMNPGFEFRYDGNPGLDLAMSEGKKHFEGSRTDLRELRKSVDIFSILKIKQPATQGEPDSVQNGATPRSMTTPGTLVFQGNGVSATPRGRYAARDSPLGSLVMNSHENLDQGFDVSESPVEATSMWLTCPGYKVEVAVGTLDPTEMRLQEHISFSDYRKLFYQKTVHTNIVGIEKTLGPVCISIQKLVMKDSDNLSDLDNALQGSVSLTSLATESGSYRVLFRERTGDRRIDIPAFLVKLRKKERFARSEDLLMALKKMMSPFSTRGLHVVRDPRSHESFALLEDKLTSNSYKFGVLYAKEGQDETGMYNNIDGSPEFEEFVTSLGDKICMKGWQKYKGGLNHVDGDLYSIYTDYQGLEVMFHISTYLHYQSVTDEHRQQWERKRFIGNDICVIVFYEGQAPISPSSFLSNFNHVFALVTAEKRKGTTYYRLHMSYKSGVAESLPRLPEESFERGEAFRTFLLTKLINAERCAMSAPQFCRTQERVRRELFQEMVQAFPKPRKRSINPAGRRSSTPEACYMDMALLKEIIDRKQTQSSSKKKKSGS